MRDNHVRVLPLHVANKIAAGEVVERPASVVKELVENALDAGATRISISITQGGRKLIAVQDDGCGMARDDAVLSLERQATSKILDVDDIERIDTLGFRGEAIPSIASVSRFSLTTRRADSDEGTQIQVNAGTLAEVRSAGCPAGTLVEVRDLFCNVPARRKFLRAYATEENHVKSIFTVHALAHPGTGFSLTVDGRELYRLAPTEKLEDRVREIFGTEFLDSMIVIPKPADQIAVSGFIERPNLNTPTRRDQYVFVNGRPASAACVAYALKEAYPRHQGDVRPAAILFIDLPPSQVDVNVHPTKREVRFRDTVAVRTAIITAIESILRPPATVNLNLQPQPPLSPTTVNLNLQPQPPLSPTPQPIPAELPITAPDGDKAKPWAWFRFLATTESGYILIETDAGVVTVNPSAARERIAFERLSNRSERPASQALLIPEMVKLSPPDFARVLAARDAVEAAGFALEEFGNDVFKVDEVPQIIGSIPPSVILPTIARDLAEGGTRRCGEHWREDLVAKSVARSFAGSPVKLDEKSAVKLVEDLAACRMPYVCPRGKPIMIFTSTRELDRKFARN